MHCCGYLFTWCKMLVPPSSNRKPSIDFITHSLSTDDLGVALLMYLSVDDHPSMSWHNDSTFFNSIYIPPKKYSSPDCDDCLLISTGHIHQHTRCWCDKKENNFYDFSVINLLPLGLHLPPPSLQILVMFASLGDLGNSHELTHPVVQMI